MCAFKCISSSLCKLTSTAVSIYKSWLYLCIFTLNTHTPTFCFLYQVNFSGFCKGFMRIFSSHSESVDYIIWMESLGISHFGVVRGFHVSVHVCSYAFLCGTSAALRWTKALRAQTMRRPAVKSPISAGWRENKMKLYCCDLQKCCERQALVCSLCKRGDLLNVLNEVTHFFVFRSCLKHFVLRAT